MLIMGNSYIHDCISTNIHRQARRIQFCDHLSYTTIEMKLVQQIDLNFIFKLHTFCRKCREAADAYHNGVIVGSHVKFEHKCLSVT